MLKGREILSLPIVTSDERKQIGEVKDLIYDPSRRIILGYLVESGGWLKEDRGFLHGDLITREDGCLVIKDESVIRSINSIPELREALNQKRDIRGLRVEHNNGHYLGVIRDLVVNGHTGEITGYEISDGVIQDLLDGRTTIAAEGITVSPDKVVADK